MRSVAPLVALLVLSLTLPPAAAVAPPADDFAQVEPQSRIGDALSTDIVVDLRGNTSARWTVSITYRLDSDVERAAFDAYRREFESDASVELSADLFRSIATESAGAVERPMRITNVVRTSSRAESRGTLSLSFTWTNFLKRIDGDTLRFHDAVLLGGPSPKTDTWLTTLEPNQTMIIRTPQGYRVNTTQAPSFDFRNNSVIMEGPQRFEGDLTITYQRTRPVTRDTPWALVGGVVASALLVAAAILLRRRGSPADEEPTGASVDTAPPPPDDGSAGEDVTHDEADDSPAEPAEDLSLLSDEERVERLLERNGGRMKQANVVRETGWSDAKVSQLLSTMADEGRIEKLRLGRENLISLPDEDDDGA